MFPGCKHPVFLETSDDGCAHRSHEVRVLAERSWSNDWIVGIAVDVEYRSERHMHAHGAPFERRHTPLLVCERRIASSAKRHLRRENRGAAEVDPVREKVADASSITSAGLVIGAEDQRHAAQAPP